MTFIEDTDSEEKTCLKLWRNTKDEIYFEMGPDGNPDPFMNQFMVLDTEDAEVLAGELMRIIREIREDQEDTEQPDKKLSHRNEHESKKPKPVPLFRFATTNGEVTKM
jgi:hypothetical protein